MHVEALSSPNFEPGRDGVAPIAVVLHTTDGSFESAASWLVLPESRVSAHYLVALDGRVVQLVDEADTAFHAGRVHEPTTTLLCDADPNRATIGIEFVDDREPATVLRPDAQYRAGAALLRAVTDRWRIPLDRAHVLAHRELNAAKTCPGNLDIDRLIAEAAALTPDPAVTTVGRSRLVVLLPARNAADDLPEWFASVRGLADAVVALDDGSTDDTAALLAAEPFVERLLHNPRRGTYAGWDDAANRQRLLDAAGDLDPDWILFLDADERLHPDDAAALRTFLDTDALPGLAYGFRHVRRWGDACDPSPCWVYRLFTYSPGQRLPADRLHFNPVPRAIPSSAYVRTTLRLQHLGAVDETRRQARLAKYREADPEGRWRTDYGGLDAPPRHTASWEPRPPDLPVLLPADGRGAQMSPRARLVVLLPARNAAADLPGWFASVRPIADAVVALDDGSTDDTAEILAAEPLVQRLLRNPVRDTYAGWDDAANRQRLLDAAADLDPDWILFLDADERLDPDDAAALRAFLDTDALPGVAYGFRIHRMVRDDRHYDQADLWVYRLFAYAPGLRLPTDRLHFVPVPTAIARRQWIRTTVRIQHLASVDAEQRRARFRKYEEADGAREFQSRYDHLLADEGPEVREWEPRAPGLPVVGDKAGDALPLDELVNDLDLDAPVLSAIVISRDDEARIERVVRSVVEQDCPEPFEVIVVTSGTDGTAQVVRKHFPEVQLVELPEPALPGAARNAGLRVARGDIVSFPGSHVELAPGSLAARVRAHLEGWEMVTGTTHNGTDTPAGWAAYFLDHSTVLPNRPAEELRAPPAHCSYYRHLLDEIGGFPEDLRAGEDTVVNRKLFGRGHRAYRAPDVVLVHHNRSDTPARLVRHYFTRGRAWGRILADRNPTGPGGSAALWRRVRQIPRRRLTWIRRDVEAWGGDLDAQYRRVRPLVTLGIMASWAGTALEVALRARDTAAPAPPTPAPATRRPVIFVHVPKTAGTALARIIVREYGRDAVLRFYGYDLSANLEQVIDLPPERLAEIEAVIGHMEFGFHRLLPAADRYVTMLRDPVDRIISHYHYVLQTADQERAQRMLDGVHSLDEYVTRSPRAWLFNNAQVRLLGGDLDVQGREASPRLLERAKRNLEEHFAVVGLRERFDESVLLMRHAFRWDWPVVEQFNATHERPRFGAVPLATRELIAERNALDIELYEFGRRLFERQVAEYGPTFTEDLARLRALSAEHAQSATNR